MGCMHYLQRRWRIQPPMLYQLLKMPLNLEKERYAAQTITLLQFRVDLNSCFKYKWLFRLIFTVYTFSGIF